MTQDDLLPLFRAHGDRTSSLAALGPQFSTFAPPGGGAVRYVDQPKGRAAAGEPLCPPDQRAAALAALAREPPGRLCVMPCGPDLARGLKALGFSVWPAGSEPVFDLARCLAPDPLLQHPLARALAKRGGEVREVTDEVRAGGGLRAALERVTRLWQEGKGLGLGFLTRCAPLDLDREKRYFALAVRGELQAFLAAAPYCRDGHVLGWYLQDLPRLPQARAGACDLLVLETMRLLQAGGAPAEDRRGVPPAHPADHLLRALFPGPARPAPGLATGPGPVRGLGLRARGRDLAGPVPGPAVPQPLVPPPGRPALALRLRLGPGDPARARALSPAPGPWALSLQPPDPRAPGPGPALGRARGTRRRAGPP